MLPNGFVFTGMKFTSGFPDFPCLVGVELLFGGDLSIEVLSKELVGPFP